MEFQVNSAEAQSPLLESRRIVWRKLLVVGSAIHIIVIREKPTVISVGESLMDYFVKDLRVLEFVSQFLQKLWGADELHHLWLTFLFVKDAQVNVKGAKLG